MTPVIYLSTVAVFASTDDIQARVEVETNGDSDDEVIDAVMKAKDAANKENSKEAIRVEGPFAFTDPPDFVATEGITF